MHDVTVPVLLNISMAQGQETDSFFVLSALFPCEISKKSDVAPSLATSLRNLV